MKDYVHMYEHPGVEQFNTDFLTGAEDYSIEELVIMCMKEFEAISNITIESVKTIYDMDKIDINEHNIVHNYKRKKNNVDVPKIKYMNDDVYAEMQFGIRIKTNLNEKFIVKKILIPQPVDGYFIFSNKKAKAIWQLVEASVYTQRSKITLKSRMPIVIYKSRKFTIKDIDDVEYEVRPYSYAMDATTKGRRKSASNAPKKTRNKFINPMMIFSAKFGVHEAIRFMGMDRVISIEEDIINKDKDKFLYFPFGEIFIKVNKEVFESASIVQSVVGMLYLMNHPGYPVKWDNLNDEEYWVGRIGLIGAAKDKRLKEYMGKGRTTLLMVERLYDGMTKMNLRLPEAHKADIYCILRWMMYEYNNLRKIDNIDIGSKRIRKNEYIVKASLGMKISVNINRIIPKLPKSRQNCMDTLLELFNFPSNIIFNAMKNYSDLIKPDELVNDMSILLDMSYSAKGPEALGEGSSKMVMLKMRDIHPSFIGIIDPNCSSNSDVGRSGSFVPTVKLYDKFFFKEEKEPAGSMYDMAKIISDSKTTKDFKPSMIEPKKKDLKSEEAFNKWLLEHDATVDKSMYPIKIVEKETVPISVVNSAAAEKPLETSQ